MGEAATEDTGINVKRFNAYADELEYFANCVKNNVKPEIVTPESSANSIRLAEQVIREAEMIK